MKKILITGGAGFIGSNLAMKLLKKGNQVVVLDNLITSDGSNIAELSTNKNFCFKKWDITEPFPEPILSVVKHVDEIYHLACPTGVSNLERLAFEMLSTCTLGTFQVLRLAKKFSSRVVFTSSSEVYGDPKVSPQKETYTGNVDSTGIRSPYEEGKRVGESIVSSFVRQKGVDAKIVRVFNTYGPGMARDDSRVIPKFFSCIMQNKSLPVQGNGSQTRTFCYVDDLVEGLQVVMKKGKKGEVYNIGSAKEISVTSLAKLMVQVTGRKSPLRFVKRPSHDHASRHPNVSKVTRLGWGQKVALKDGLAKTHIWYGF